MRRWCATAVAMMASVLSGCGMNDAGLDVQVAPAEIPDAAVAGGASLVLPTARPFNIHLKNSTQTPGADGKARGDSDASPDGQAFCLADAGNGGTAGAEFKLGQRIQTGEGAAYRAAIRIEFQVRQSTQTTFQPLPKSVGTGSLEVLVLNSRRRVLAHSSLATFTTDDSVGSAVETHERTLSVILEPHDTCDILLFGKVEASAAQGQETTVRLDLRQLKMTIDLQPAATQPSAVGASTRQAG